MSVIPARNKDLEYEVKNLVYREFPSDQRTVDYVSHLLAFPPISGLKEIMLNWTGIVCTDLPEDDDERKRNIETKVRNSKEIGDRCLTSCIFYLDDLEKSGMVNLADLGKAGYHVAGLYSNFLDMEEKSYLYTNLSEQFFPLVARLSYAVRKYLDKDFEPPYRIILWTPYGETIFKVGYSRN